MIFSKRFIPLFAAMFFLANPIFSQGGMLLPSTWPEEVQKDTIAYGAANGWSVIKHTQPVGKLQWIYMFERGSERTYEYYMYDINGVQVWCHEAESKIMSIWDTESLNKSDTQCPYQSPPANLKEIIWKR